MVAISATNGATINADGVLTLTDGRTFTLADVNGNGWGAGRLRKLNEMVQEIIDHRRAISSLAADDPDRIRAEAGDDAWFLATYGGRMFIDGSDIVSRSTLVEITFDGVELSAAWSEVR